MEARYDRDQNETPAEGRVGMVNFEQAKEYAKSVEEARVTLTNIRPKRSDRPGSNSRWKVIHLDRIDGSVFSPTSAKRAACKPKSSKSGLQRSTSSAERLFQHGRLQPRYSNVYVGMVAR
jgi:hypothetical protein